MNIYSLTIKTFKRVIIFFVISFPLQIGVSFAQQDICLVTVDSTSTKNIIVWEKPVTTAIDSFKVYRDIIGVYTHIGSVSYDSSFSFFIDSMNGLNPQITSYKYKLSVVDTAGIESALSAFHETIHLLAALGIPPSINLIWDGYVGFSFSYYRILRDTIGTGNFQVIDSVSSVISTWTDISPPTCSNVYYRIEVPHPTGCVSTAKALFFNSSISNTVSVITSPISLSVSTTDATCGNADGSASVSVSNGTPPYTYSWSSGDTLANADSLFADIYIITVTDVNGCSNFALAMISDADGPVISNVFLTDITCNDGSDGAIAIIVIGGTPSYTYLWSNGVTASFISNLVAGPYEVTVTDASGCVAITSITVSEPTAMILNLSTINANCGNADGSATVSVSNGTPPYTYSWSSGDTLPDADSLASGIYVVTVTDVNGCMKTDSVTIFELSPGPQTSAIIGAVNVSENTLENYTVTLNSGSIYDWLVIGGAQLSGGQTNAISVLWDSIGVGTLSVVETDTVGCTGDTVSLTVNISSTGINQFQVSGFGFEVYPNPYTGKTQISYRLQKNTDILLVIYNILGKKVQTLVNERQISGDHYYNFSAKDSGYGAGIYIVKFIISEQIYTKQLVEF